MRGRDCDRNMIRSLHPDDANVTDIFPALSTILQRSSKRPKNVDRAGDSNGVLDVEATLHGGGGLIGVVGLLGVWQGVSGLCGAVNGDPSWRAAGVASLCARGDSAGSSSSIVCSATWGTNCLQLVSRGRVATRREGGAGWKKGIGAVGAVDDIARGACSTQPWYASGECARPTASCSFRLAIVTPPHALAMLKGAS